jgi:hypothetical protein
MAARNIVTPALHSVKCFITGGSDFRRRLPSEGGNALSPDGCRLPPGDKVRRTSCSRYATAYANRTPLATARSG